VSRAREFHPWKRPGSLLGCRAASRGLGSCFSRAGLALARPEAPRAFRDFDVDSIQGQLVCWTPKPRGSLPALRPFTRPEHPSARGNDRWPRPGRWPSPPLDSAPREALRLSLDTGSRCFEIASTTDVSRHEHPCVDTTFRDCPPSAVGNPPAFDLETAPGHGAFPQPFPGRRRTTSRSSGLRRLPRLTARRRLRADQHSHVPCRAGARVWEESTAACSAGGSSAGSSPLATSRGDGGCAERSDAVT
jgi:hypothetical protein